MSHASSNKSAVRNQLFPADRVVRASSGAKSVQLSGISPAFLVEEAHSVLTAVFFARESFELTTSERVKGMGDSKLLRFYSTNACSATPFPCCSFTGELW